MDQQEGFDPADIEVFVGVDMAKGGGVGGLDVGDDDRAGASTLISSPRGARVVSAGLHDAAVPRDRRSRRRRCLRRARSRPGVDRVAAGVKSVGPTGDPRRRHLGQLGGEQLVASTAPAAVTTSMSSPCASPRGLRAGLQTTSDSTKSPPPYSPQPGITGAQPAHSVATTTTPRRAVPVDIAHRHGVGPPVETRICTPRCHLQANVLGARSVRPERHFKDACTCPPELRCGRWP